jgi:hypothetical protein
MTDADLVARKAQLIAQCDLDRMRLTHALLVTRRSLNPFSAGGMRSLAVRAFAVGLPMFVAAKRGGLLRFAALALKAIRAVRGFLRR